MRKLSKGEMRKIHFMMLFIGTLLFFKVPIASGPIYQDPEISKDLLDEILKKSAEYCEQLTHSVLDFVCRERIIEEINMVDSRQREIFGDSAGKTMIKSSVWQEGRELNTYTYDYQMIRIDGIVTNKRILLRENGIKKYEENAEPKIKRFKHHNILFGPIALLDLQRQPFYDYKIVGREKFKRKSVVIIEAIPKQTSASENPWGKIWVKDDDYSIVKIEWDQRSLPNLAVFEEDAKNFRAIPKITFNLEFGYEKNGIRFPRYYSVVETYYRGEAFYFVRSKLDTTYDRYRFFTVETEVKY